MFKIRINRTAPPAGDHIVNIQVRVYNMNILACVGLLICVCTAYASGLPSPAHESSSSLKVAPETPGEVLAPEESRGYGYGGGWGGGRGWGGGWGGGRGWGGGWDGGRGYGWRR
ncbi:probable H/ACA ribonucleoprotein complex subunit 1 isoform X2 [Melitaea cinxia]|uniref:probable H/ACA ribonucleoprotein complex subunit 1 isoform X2 n=1 Tax=Melitaea cinxia TaxID=113334 RepID=UPI001E2746B9|nr:probable H/ACA ribonucleoprotein complex subunit 1 isoform X2 [Melitaea cinxia]